MVITDLWLKNIFSAIQTEKQYDSIYEHILSASILGDVKEKSYCGQLQTMIYGCVQNA